MSCYVSNRNRLLIAAVAAQADFHAAFGERFADDDFDREADEVGVLELDAGAGISESVYGGGQQDA